MLLSQQDYILGMACEKALWLKKNRPELVPDIDLMLERWSDISQEEQELARHLFTSGKMLGDGDISYMAYKTKELAENNDVLFEATALLPNKAFARIDIMQREGSAWNLMEIKLATKVKPIYINDLAYQKFIFENAGYKINRTKVILLNEDYTLHGALDLEKLFVIEDITLNVDEVYANVGYNTNNLWLMIQKTEEPFALRHKVDPCKQCAFKPYCFENLPDYPAFSLFYYDRSWQKFYNQYGSYFVEDIPEDYDLRSNEKIDREAFLTNQIHAEPAKIKEWLDLLVYPLYYLDYETAQLAIPLFEQSHPYTQIPFQFSLHVQETKGGEVKHFSFLHKEKSDPRRALAECLVEYCKTKGSVVVYNKSFEKTRNTELAALFPDLAEKIYNINYRLVDQLEIFKNRFLYSPLQKGSASIKYVLPAFCSLSYDDMEIHNGSEAMTQYEAFLKGKQTPEETANMFSALEKYCAQDTMAMVKIMEVLYKYAEI